jgi:hypothetical protein
VNSIAYRKGATLRARFKVRIDLDPFRLLDRYRHVDRPDILIAAPAACVTAGLVVFSQWGYSRTRHKTWIDLGLFVAATGAVAGFFVAIFAALLPSTSECSNHSSATSSQRRQAKARFSAPC